MRPCSLCVKGNKQCLVGVGSERCSNCIINGRKCDLVISVTEMRRVEKARRDVRSEIRATVAKLARLQAQEDRIEEEKKKLVERELQNIEELEADERSDRAAPSSEDFLFDVSSESFEVPEGLEGFDWPAFPISHETAAEAPGSSQGS